MDDIAVDVFREQCQSLAIRDRHHEVLELMQQAPQEVIQSDPDLAFWYALSLLSIADYTEGKQAAEAFTRAYARPDDALNLGRGYLLQSHLYIMDGDTEASYNHELKTVAVLPETAYHERLRSWATIDTMAGHMGDTVRMEQAIVALADVRNNLPFDQSWWYSFVVPNRADILAKRGFLSKAKALLLAQLPTVPQEESEIIKLRLAVIALEAQDPNEALKWLTDVAHDGPGAYWSMEAHLVASQVERLLGNTERALQILRDGMAMKVKNRVRADLTRFELHQCEIWIREGEIELAEAWVKLASKGLDPWPRTFGHPIPNLVLAQFEMAQGNWSTAIGLLEALRDEGIRRDHAGLLVGIYAHLGYAHAANGEREQAVKMVQLSVESARNGSFTRSFNVFETDVRSFLKRIPGGVGGIRPVVSPHASDSILSYRELEVLKLVGAGKRNREIADELYLSISTVKNHLANINKRLGVTNRRAAVRIAEQWGIIRNVRSEDA